MQMLYWMVMENSYAKADVQGGDFGAKISSSKGRKKAQAKSSRAPSTAMKNSTATDTAPAATDGAKAFSSKANSRNASMSACAVRQQVHRMRLHFVWMPQLKTTLVLQSTRPLEKDLSRDQSTLRGQ